MRRARSPALGTPAPRTCAKCGVLYEAGKFWKHRQTKVHKNAPSRKINAKDPDFEPGFDEKRQPVPDNLQELLDTHEEGVLYLLCREGRYDSVVTLAADYYEHSEEIQQDRVLEWNLVELLLDDLNKAGLVVYRFAPTPLGEVMVRIKPTFKGYARIAAKFKIEFRWIHEVGARAMRYDTPIRSANDRTDFRTHSEQAEGIGEIVREDFIEHCSLCDHVRLHLSQLREVYGTDQL